MIACSHPLFDGGWGVGIINLLAGDACIAPTYNRDLSISNRHNRRVEACFDRYLYAKSNEIAVTD